MRSNFSYQFGKQFNVLLLLKRRSAPGRFVDNRLFPRIVSDCVVACMFEVRRDKCTLIENSKNTKGLLQVVNFSPRFHTGRNIEERSNY